jgi:hypothetical protein
MNGRAAAPFPEVLKIVEREIEARHVREAVQERAAVAGRENEAIAVGAIGSRGLN